MRSNGASIERNHGAAQARFEERHFTVAEIGEKWTLSTDVVRKLFESEPGVTVIGEETPRGKRRYTTLRIPQSVAERAVQSKAKASRLKSTLTEGERGRKVQAVGTTGCY